MEDAGLDIEKQKLLKENGYYAVSNAPKKYVRIDENGNYVSLEKKQVLSKTILWLRNQIDRHNDIIL